MNAKRKRAVKHILALRRKVIEQAGYTAGVEGLPEDPNDIEDAFWERVAKAYNLMLHDEGLVDDVTEKEEEEVEPGQWPPQARAARAAQ